MKILLRPAALSVLLLLSMIVQESKAMMMMPMYFWKGTELTWLWYHLDSSTPGEYAGGLIVVFLVGVVIEAVTWMRNFVYIKSQISAIRATEELNR